MSAELLFGDCMELMKSLPDASVDTVIADMPFGTTQNKWDSVLPLADLWHEYMRICKGTFVLHAAAPFDKALGMSNIRMLRYEWIWEKTHPTGHLNAKKAPMKAHENILVFAKGLPVYNPIKTTGHKRKTATKRRDVTPTYGAQKFGELPYDSTERYPRSIVVFPSDKQRSNLHPTQKPLALMEYLVRTHSEPGAVVLDNCMGSGTTGVACLMHGRRFIGMENAPEHFSTAQKRISETITGTAP